jgi:hypothetical protein
MLKITPHLEEEEEEEEEERRRKKKKKKKNLFHLTFCNTIKFLSINPRSMCVFV